MWLVWLCAGCAKPADTVNRADAAPPRAVVPGATNVSGGPLATCSTRPLTGFHRDGRCTTGPDDRGTHVVCARVSERFLDFTRGRGNDLVTPRPELRFPGLAAGDRWCLCALRWREALEAGVAPEVDLAATDVHALEYVDRESLTAHALR